MSVGSATIPCCGGLQMLRHIRHGGICWCMHVLPAGSATPDGRLPQRERTGVARPFVFGDIDIFSAPAAAGQTGQLRAGDRQLPQFTSKIRCPNSHIGAALQGKQSEVQP
jgi:hypothetical protein